MSTSDNTVFIYVLQRISDKAYLYIGSAKNPARRFYEHRRSNPYRAIQEAFAQDNLRFITLAKTDEAHRVEAEAKLWRQFKDAGHPLINRDPAVSRLPSNKGRVHSEDARRNMSLAHKGKRLTEEQRRKIGEAQKGRKIGPLSEEHKRKLSDSHKGKPSHMKGKKHSEETKRKVSEKKRGCKNPHKGMPWTEETRRKASESRRGKRRGPMSEAQKRRLSEVNKGKKHSPETRQKMSETHKAIQRKKREGIADG